MFSDAINSERERRYFESSILKLKREHMPVYAQRLKESILKQRAALENESNGFSLYEEIPPEK